MGGGGARGGTFMSNQNSVTLKSSCNCPNCPTCNASHALLTATGPSGPGEEDVGAAQEPRREFSALLLK